MKLRSSIGAIAAAFVAASVIAVAAPGGPAGAATPSLPAPNSHGITLQGPLSAVPGKPRLFDATMTTAAVFTPRGIPVINPVTVPVKVRIMLPAGYDPDRAEPYPVLYLLHGGTGDFDDWSTDGNVVTTLDATADDGSYDGIVVMPEGGRTGWYSDWFGRTDGNFAPQWETFHVGQLVPWIDANFNTWGDRSGRAIAGLSMGGYGALRYAGRFPATFSAVGGFSSGTDIRPPAAQNTISNSMWSFGASIGTTGLLDGHYRVNPPFLSGLDPVKYRLETVFGPQAGWSSVNPFDLATAYNAYDGRFGLYAGGLEGTGGETDIGAWNQVFHNRLVSPGVDVDHRWCGGTGGHDWVSWKAYLQDFVRYLYDETPAACPN